MPPRGFGTHRNHREEGLGKASGSPESFSVRGLAKITGEDWSYIAKILRTLDLPESVKDFLRSNKDDPVILQFFHLRKLLDIVRQGEERLQLSRFRELIEELELANKTS